MLTEEHESTIIERINKSALKSKELKDDLIDHFCCLVEIYMDKGDDFERAYAKAMKQTSPDGLASIERETVYLLNYKKIVLMKKLMFISGYLFTATWLVGLFFKIMHLPGAAVLMVAGGLGAGLVFLPLFLINKLKDRAVNVMNEKMKYILGVAVKLLILLATTMKFLHLQGAGFMLGLSFLVLTFGFMPYLFFTLYKNSVDKL